MPNDLRIQIESQFNAGPLKAGMADAASAVQVGGKQMQAAFEGIGTAVGDASAQVLNLLYPTAQAVEAAGEAAATAAPEVAALGESANVAAGGFRNLSNATAQARVEAALLDGSGGMLANSLARLAGQSSALAPIIAAAFPLFAIGAFVDIAAMGVRKIFDLYQNVILLKSSIQGLEKADEAAGAKAAEMNVQYEESLARRLEAQGKLNEATAEFAKAAGDKPLQLVKIDDKNFKQFSAEFVTFMQGVHATSEAPTVIARIQAEAASAEKQLKDAKAAVDSLETGPPLIAAGSMGMATVEDNILALGNAQALVTDLTEKVNLLHNAISQVQSQSGIALNQALEKAAADAKKLEEAENSAAKKREEAAAKDAQLLNAEQEASKRQAAAELRDVEAVQRRKEEAAKKAEDLARQEAEARQRMFASIDEAEKDAARKHAELQRQEAETDAAIQARLDAATKKSTADQVKAFEDALKPINRSFDEMVTGVMQGTQTMGMAFAHLGGDIILSTANALGQALLKHVEHAVAVNAVHAASVATQTATTAAGATTQQGILTVAHLKEVLLSAKGAAAGAFHWVMSTVPFPLNAVLAPAAAAGAFSAVLAFAEKGAVLPSDMLVQAHKNEMILPERLSTGIQGMINGGGAGNGSGGGDVHVHSSPSISAMDGEGLGKVLSKHRSELVKQFRGAVRDGRGLR